MNVHRRRGDFHGGFCCDERKSWRIGGEGRGGKKGRVGSTHRSGSRRKDTKRRGQLGKRVRSVVSWEGNCIRIFQEKRREVMIEGEGVEKV